MKTLILILLGRILLPITLVSGQNKVKKAKEDKPIEYYEKLVENSQKALELHNQGFKHYRKQEYQEALKLFNQAIALDTVNAHYFSNRGHTHKNLGNWKEALADYQKANQIDPTATHETYFHGGEILQKYLNKPEKAIKMYTQAIERIKENGMVLEFYKCYFNRGNCELKLENYQQAIEDYSKSIEFNPNYYGSYVNRGVARYNLKDQDGACSDWHKAVELGSKGANGYINSYCK